MHTENLHTMHSLYAGYCRNSKSSMIVWHLEHRHMPLAKNEITLHSTKKKLLNELKKIKVNFSTKCNYIFPPKSNLFEMSCCNLVV